MDDDETAATPAQPDPEGTEPTSAVPMVGDDMTGFVPPVVGDSDESGGGSGDGPSEPPGAAATGGSGEGPDAGAHKRTRRHWLEIGGAVVVAVAAVLLIGWGLGWFSGQSTFAMPNVVGKTQAAATAALRQAGLDVSSTSLVTSPQPEGTVTKSVPDAGDSVVKGDSVALFVAVAQVVPDVVGKSVGDAESELSGAGLTVKVHEVQNSAPGGTVLDQNPLAGVRVAHGTQIGLTVSTGSTSVVVPNVTGMSPTQAASALSAAGLGVGQQTTSASNVIGTGAVVGTDPAAGTSQPTGTKVNLIVSSGPESVIVQSVIGQQQAAATSTLQAQGFKVSVTPTATCQPAQHGEVVIQSPGPGATAPNGSEVTISLCTTTTTTTTTPAVGSTTPTTG